MQRDGHFPVTDVHPAQHDDILMRLKGECVCNVHPSLPDFVFDLRKRIVEFLTSGCVQSIDISVDAQFCPSPRSAVGRSTEEAKDDVVVSDGRVPVVHQRQVNERTRDRHPLVPPIRLRLLLYNQLIPAGFLDQHKVVGESGE